MSTTWLWDPQEAARTAAAYRSVSGLVTPLRPPPVLEEAARLVPVGALGQDLHRLDAEATALSQDLRDHAEELDHASQLVQRHVGFLAHVFTAAREALVHLPGVKELSWLLPGAEWLLHRLPTLAAGAHIEMVPAGDDWSLGARTLADWLTRAGRLDTSQFAVSLLEGPPPVAVVVLPGIHTALDVADARDLPGAFRELVNGGSAYHEAVVQALQQMDLPPGVQIAIVGHSQGGITAVDVAGDPRVRALGTVTHVVVAGAPVDGLPTPTGTRMLEAINPGDVVPKLDGVGPPGGRVVVRGLGGSPAPSHAISGTPLSYATLLALPGVLGRTDVKAFTASAPWLHGGPARTTLVTALDGRRQSREGAER